MAMLPNGKSFIGLRCDPEVEAAVKRHAARRGWTVTEFVLRALDSALAADVDRRG